MNNNNIIQIVDAVPRLQDIAFQHPVNWTIEKGQHWAVIGPNGAGKTILTDMLTGKYALKSGTVICRDTSGSDRSVSSVVKSVAFRDIYSLSDIQNSYYQQRWNAGDVHDVPLVRDLLEKNADADWLAFLIRAFNINDLVDKEINLLSSGELRKFLIVRSLIRKPEILILDNPFIGLDAASRIILNDLLVKLASFGNLQVMLILSNPDDIPGMVTHILPVKDKTIGKVLLRADFLNDKNIRTELFAPSTGSDISGLKNPRQQLPSFSNALIFNNIRIKYGRRVILNGINWQIKKGEKWALLGENGSGKSTLLSLVSGDNPQAYANDITLFDRRRGSGESIWDIKKRIGYISPEMHLYYLKNVKCIDVVGSGFFDTIGLYRKCNAEQETEAQRWLEVFGVGYLRDVSFLNISTGEQRLVLLARVFVKNPDLLILDEPLHGLDIANKHRVRMIIENFCDRDKSLIYVTHYENEIPSVVDKRLVLKKYTGN